MRSLPALVLTAAVIACTSDEPAPGQLMLAITSDLLPANDIDRLTVEVKRPEGAIERSQTFDLGKPTGSSLPSTLGLTAATAPDSPLVIRVHAYSNADKTYVLREVVTSIPPDRIGLVRVPLEFLCFGSGYYIPEQDYVEAECLDETTCKGGVCEPPEIVQTALPTYDDALVFGGGPPEGGGRCFDTLGCFAADQGGLLVAAPAGAGGAGGAGGGGGAGGASGGGASGTGGAGGTGSGGPCTIDIPNGLEVANVALVSDGRHGLCYASGPCLIPLERGLPSGWSANGGTIELPPGVCNPPGWFKGAVTQIALTPACDPKAPDVPVCGPSSAVGPGSPDTAAPPMGL